MIAKLAKIGFISVISFLVISFSLTALGAQSSQLAFPDAMGYGRFSKGGRGGAVIEVTNLNDSGAGSLRAALDASGPRTVVFRVGGTISLSSDLWITNPYITVAGQTAPGGGIAIKNGTLHIDTSNVIVRYIRVRPGPGVSDPGNGDGIFIRSGGSNVIVDHVSASWATDENLTVYGEDVTVSNSIISEGLNNAGHPEGGHSKGAFTSFTGDRVTYIRNLFAHNEDRNPFIKIGQNEIVNNMIYNAGVPPLIQATDGLVKVNFIGNYQKAGVDTQPDKGDKSTLRIPPDNTYDEYTYIKDNLGPTRQSSSVDEREIITYQDEWKWIVSNQFAMSYPPVIAASSVPGTILPAVGASLPARDSVDGRIVANAQSGSAFSSTQGTIIDNPSEVGGYPTLGMGTAPVDADHDGMPDSWESQKGFNPSVSDGAQDRDGDGYTNLEEFLNGTDPGVATTTTTPTPTPTSTPIFVPTASPSSSPTATPSPTAFRSSSPTPTATPTPTAVKSPTPRGYVPVNLNRYGLVGDVNGDGVVNLRDLRAWFSVFTQRISRFRTRFVTPRRD